MISYCLCVCDVVISMDLVPELMPLDLMDDSIWTDSENPSKSSQGSVVSVIYASRIEVEGHLCVISYCLCVLLSLFCCSAGSSA